MVVYYSANDLFFKGALHDQFPGLIAFFFLQSLIVAWLFGLGEKDGWKTPIYALGAVTFRFLTALFFLLILFTMKLEGIRALMIQFITLYLGYLVFELFAVLPNLRRN